MEKKTQTNNNKDRSGISKKDLIIVILSVISLLLLIAIIVLSKRSQQEVSAILEKESELVDGSSTNIVKDLSDYIQFSEANADKWIEIYNYGSDKADISGLQIFVSGKKAATVADNTEILKGQYYTIDLDVNPGEKDINILNIKTAENEDILHMIIPKLSEGQSYGKANVEGEDIGFLTATKGAANDPTKIVYEEIEGIRFSAPTGFYDATFELTLSAGEGEKIYYTTDGTIPTTDSEEYTAPIVVRNFSGSTYTYAYLGFGRTKKTGYNPKSIDKGMVVNAIRVNSSGKILGQATQEYYVGMRKDVSYNNIPILSLTINPDDMFDYFTGIYVPGKTRDDYLIQGLSGGANYVNKWVKECKLSYFEPTKGKTMEIPANVKVHFNGDVNKAQKALEFSVGDISKYSESSLYEYVGADDTLVIEQFLDDDNYKVRALIGNAMMENSAVGTTDMSPVVLFIDGEYWGVYLMKAPYDRKYIERNYNLKNENIVLRSYTGEYNTEFMNFYNFVTGNDMSLTSNYNTVKEQMDIESYLEYICGCMYMGVSDFRSTKTTVWKTNRSNGVGYSDGKWRWLMSPTTKAMANSSVQNYPVNTFLQQGIQLDPLFQSLLMNKEFCNQMVKVMQQMADERFSQERYQEIIQKYASLMKRPAVDNYSRFYGTLSSKLFDTEIENITGFYENRSEFILQYTQELAKKGGDLQHIAEHAEELAALAAQEQAEDSEEAAAEGSSGELLDEDGQVIENPDDYLDDDGLTDEGNANGQ